MSSRIVTTEQKSVEWNPSLRPKVKDTVIHQGLEWSNLTGKNSEPGVGNDWKKISSLGAQQVYLDSISELNSLNRDEKIIAEVLNFSQTVDGGGGSFYWDPISEETPINGIIIGVQGVNQGRWKRILQDKRVTPEMTGVKQKDVAYSQKLQDFFDIISTPEYDYVGDFRGEWYVDQTISIKGSGKTFICGKINGLNNGNIEPLIDINSTSCDFKGLLTAHATGASSYSVKNQKTGIDWANSGSRNTFENITANGFTGYGIKIFGLGGGSTIMESVDRIKITGCGSTGTGYIQGSAVANVSNVVNSGISSSVLQRSVITVDNVDPNWVDNELLEINGKIHIIDTVSGNDITVYPWVNNSFTGEIYGLHGGLLIAGPNSASTTIEKIDAIRCGSALRIGGLYGSIVDVVQSQFCGIALALGYVENSNNLGSTINQFYSENDTFGIAQITRVDTNTKIHMITPRLNVFIMEALTGTFERSYTNQLKAVVTKDSSVYNPTAQLPKNKRNQASTISLSNSNYGNKISVIKNNPVFRLKYFDDINSVFGNDTIEISALGTGNNNQPTGTVSFILDEEDELAGITVMGGTSFQLSLLSNPVNAVCFFDFENQNWIISNTTGLPKTTATWEIQNNQGGILKLNNSTNQISNGQIIGGLDFFSEDISFAEGDEKLSRFVAVADGALGVGSAAKVDLVYLARQAELEAHSEQFRITSNGITKSKRFQVTEAFTVANLPAGEIGQIARVTDADTPSYRSIVVGGGTENCLVFFDGANWICH